MSRAPLLSIGFWCSLPIAGEVAPPVTVFLDFEKNAVFAAALGCFIYAVKGLLTPQLLRQIGLTVNIGKTEIPALKSVGQPRVVDSQ